MDKAHTHCIECMPLLGYGLINGKAHTHCIECMPLLGYGLINGQGTYTLYRMYAITGVWVN